MRKKFFNSDFSKISLMRVFLEGEGGGAGGEGGAGGTEEKKFTQKELDGHVAKAKREIQQGKEKLVAELQQLRETARLTAEEKDALSQRIDALRAEYETAEDRHKRTSKEREENFVKEKETLTKERDSWKTRYTTETIARAIKDAAVAHDAISADDILALVGGNATLEEVLENEKPTGEYAVKIKFTDTDADGKKTNLLLEPAEMVGRMRKNAQRYGHLFKSGQSGGSGASSSSRSGAGGGNARITAEDVKTNPRLYDAYRKQEGFTQ